MNRVILATLFATLATGCILAADTDPGEYGFIHARWSFSTAEGTALSCPEGFSMTEVIAEPVRGGPPIIDLYDCEAFGGSAGYPIGEYDVTIVIVSDNG